MPESALTIPCDDITLEGVLHIPAGGGPLPLVVVCHPHPRYGGDMDNNVLMAVVRALTRGGIAALRFNFRGVGRSRGSHGGGSGEQDDVRAALALSATLPDIDAARIGLAGYSFGAWMAALTAGPSIAALALIAVPLVTGPDVRPALAAYPHPLLLLAGDNDHVCPVAALRDLAATLGPPQTDAEIHIVPGTDHFWMGHERELEEITGEFFARHLATET